MSALLAPLLVAALAQVPHNQSQPPNAPLTPAQAVERMRVPDGFRVELVASEPEIVNPVAMCFDERGRLWLTESVEYPRREPGPGRDRVKVLEDTDGDGRADRFTVFADGLNIPSGIAVGSGGVWVANAPDLLLLHDDDGDGRADRREVVVTGFGREDVHEVPNSLTWGPDGWLYGLNGVFNESVIHHQGKTHRFTCAMFRVHPRTRAFEVFARGTSNPWGIAFDGEGAAFVSACVIDHLWHLTESGVYQRQAGPQPAHAWEIGSIVRHHHQKAAYCGLVWFDADAYPPAYRGRLYMGNIHGGCVNVDRLERDGASYLGVGEADFLSADDAWFMPVAQQVGPDGCLYVLDWYDRYHCYQDANRDPEGIDRSKGRLYRVRYGATPRAGGFDLAAESDEALIARLDSANVWFRSQAQRLLAERGTPAVRERLAAVLRQPSAPRRQRLHALWAAIGAGPLDDELHRTLLEDPDATVRAWAVRAAGDAETVSAAVAQRVAAAADDAAADVRLQVAIAAGKLGDVDATDVLLTVAARSGDDPLLARIVWQNLHPRLDADADRLVELIAASDLQASPALAGIVPRAVERWLGAEPARTAPALALLHVLIDQHRDADAASCLRLLAARVANGELDEPALGGLRTQLAALLAATGAAPSTELQIEATLLAATWADPDALRLARAVFADARQSFARRTAALAGLAAADDAGLPEAAARVLAQATTTLAFGRAVLARLARSRQPRVAELVLAAYADAGPSLRAAVIDLLVQRRPWRSALLEAVAAARVPASDVQPHQIRALLAGDDPTTAAAAERIWAVRELQRPDRDAVIARTRQLLRQRRGDPLAGRRVFATVCASCHRIYGEGPDLGPDLTGSGRGSLEQLLSNVLDPNLVVGAAYQLHAITTTDGRTVAGILREQNDQRTVLALPNAVTETIAARDIARSSVQPVSLMPEGLEASMNETELVDLFAFLCLDRPPEDPAAVPIAGAALQARETSDPAEFGELVDAVAPGFSVRASGEGGIALQAEHLGRRWVLRTHPVDRRTPCTLERTLTLPAGQPAQLHLAVAHHDRRRFDWRLVVQVDEATVHDSIVGPETSADGWREISVDLGAYAGRSITLRVQNRANDWNNEFGYFGEVRIR